MQVIFDARAFHKMQECCALDECDGNAEMDL